MPPPQDFVIDHVFICTLRRAPAADLLIEAGLAEGNPNTHPGQGTACRRFFFANSMLELLWLADEAEARSEQTRLTRLFERLSGGASVCPFGVILRPAIGSESIECPWPAWSYRPSTMPGLELEIAAGTDLFEPMWCLFRGGRARSGGDHPVGFRDMTRVTIGGPRWEADSVTSEMARQGVIGVETRPEPVMEVEFDGGRARGLTLDFRGELPLIIRA